MLPLVGIAALMAAGLVVLMAALTFDESLAHERRRRRKRFSTRAHDLLLRRSEARRLAVTLSSSALMAARHWGPRLQQGAGAVWDAAVAEGRWGAALARHWWPYVLHHARVVRYRWLTLESTVGQLLLVVVGSLLAAFIVVAFG